MKALIWIALVTVVIVGIFIGCSKNSTDDNNSAPAAPSNVLVTQTAPYVVQVAWTDNSSNEDNFVIQRSVDSTGWQNILTVGANSTSVYDSTTLANRKYYYRVRAENSYGSSDYANSRAFWTLNAAPRVPSNVIATQTTRFVMRVTWTDNSANEDSFIVQRSTDNITWQHVGSVNMNVTGLNDNGSLADTKYYYRVRADNSFGSSDYSSSSIAYWTWPAVYDFSTDHTDYFDTFDFDTVNYHTWTWDNAAQAGKMTITHPTATQFLVSIECGDSMANNGWFESRVKIVNWYGTTRKSEVAYFVEKDPSQPDEAVGLIINADSLRFGYYVSGGSFMNRLVEMHNDYFTPNAWHVVKFFHNGETWKVWVDSHLIFNAAIPNIVTGNYKLIQEWQFDRGDGPNNQNYWLDDVANADTAPELRSSPGFRHVMKNTSRPVVKK